MATRRRLFARNERDRRAQNAGSGAHTRRSRTAQRGGVTLSCVSAEGRKRRRDEGVPIDLSVPAASAESPTFPAPAVAKAVALGCVWPLAIVSALPLLLVPFVVLSGRGRVFWSAVPVAIAWTVLWGAVAQSLWSRA